MHLEIVTKMAQRVYTTAAFIVDGTWGGSFGWLGSLVIAPVVFCIYRQRNFRLSLTFSQKSAKNTALSPKNGKKRYLFTQNRNRNVAAKDSTRPMAVFLPGYSRNSTIPATADSTTIPPVTSGYSTDAGTLAAPISCSM